MSCKLVSHPVLQLWVLTPYFIAVVMAWLAVKAASQAAATLGHYKDAQDTLAEAQRQFVAIGTQLGAAQCLQSLGDVQHMQGNHKGAQDMLAEAQCQFVAIGDQQGVAQCLQGLGDIQCMLGNHKDTWDTLSEA
ncbi:hypothetical protein K439DRAFT_1622511 [Ramaria rubella]|nr:hypothetical protein K439DRAFT_1622511 [Ramaria rubella]